jgi:hypothetical protein
MITYDEIREQNRRVNPQTAELIHQATVWTNRCMDARRALQLASEVLGLELTNDQVEQVLEAFRHELRKG